MLFGLLLGLLFGFLLRLLLGFKTSLLFRLGLCLGLRCRFGARLLSGLLLRCIRRIIERDKSFAPIRLDQAQRAAPAGFECDPA